MLALTTESPPPGGAYVPHHRMHILDATRLTTAFIRHPDVTKFKPTALKLSKAYVTQLSTQRQSIDFVTAGFVTEDPTGVRMESRGHLRQRQPTNDFSL